MAYNKEDNSELRALQMVELEIMRIFTEICDRHNLRYYIVGGTMLGAVRHKGFIPWDDDMDVGMPRLDYEKFMEIAPAELPEGFAVRSFRHDESYDRCFSKLVNTRVVLTNDSNTVQTTEFAWLDIFPFDGMPGSRLGRFVHFWHATFWRFLYQASCFKELVNLNRPGRPFYIRMIIKFLAITHFGQHMDTRKLLFKMDKVLSRYPYDSSPYMVSFYGQYMMKEIVDKKLLGEGKKYPFENIVLNGPENYDAFLTQFYGDYMKPPADSDKNKLNISKIDYEEKGA